MAHEEQDQGQPIEPRAYSQLSLVGGETEGGTEVVLENCVALSRPRYTKQRTNGEWHCRLHAAPDIFHQDRDEVIEAHTTTYADTAKRLHVKPGDRVDATGRLQHHVVELMGGEKQTVTHLFVTEMQVIARAKRESLTIYERERGR